MPTVADKFNTVFSYIGSFFTINITGVNVGKKDSPADANANYGAGLVYGFGAGLIAGAALYYYFGKQSKPGITARGSGRVVNNSNASRDISLGDNASASNGSAAASHGGSATVFGGNTFFNLRSGNSQEQKINRYLFELGYNFKAIELKLDTLKDNFSSKEQIRIHAEKYDQLCIFLNIPTPPLEIDHSSVELTSYLSILQRHFKVHVTTQYPDDERICFFELGMECFNFEISKDKKDLAWLTERAQSNIRQTLKRLSCSSVNVDEMFSKLTDLTEHRDISSILLETANNGGRASIRGIVPQF